jgi:hypothetical protein
MKDQKRKHIDDLKELGRWITERKDNGVHKRK